MEKITSFKIDHLKLERGVYVMRKDNFNGITISTIDIRMKRPNREPVINTAELHTLEHLGAVYLRNYSRLKDKVIYFGPMGCRTGFELVLLGDYESKDLLDVIVATFEFIANYEGDIPGQSAKECGNYLDHNLPMAKYHANDFLQDPLLKIKDINLNYPTE